MIRNASTFNTKITVSQVEYVLTRKRGELLPMPTFESVIA